MNKKIYGWLIDKENRVIGKVIELKKDFMNGEATIQPTDLFFELNMDNIKLNIRRDYKLVLPFAVEPYGIYLKHNHKTGNLDIIGNPGKGMEFRILFEPTTENIIGLNE